MFLINRFCVWEHRGAEALILDPFEGLNPGNVWQCRQIVFLARTVPLHLHFTLNHIHATSQLCQKNLGQIAGKRRIYEDRWFLLLTFVWAFEGVWSLASWAVVKGIQAFIHEDLDDLYASLSGSHLWSFLV